MKLVRALLIPGTLLGALALLATGCAPKKSFAGTWKGTLTINLPNVPRPIIAPLTFHVTAKDGNTYAATIDSAVNRTTAYPVKTFSVDNDKVSIAIENKGETSTFTGTASADASEIKGSFSQGGKDFPLTLKKEPDAK